MHARRDVRPTGLRRAQRHREDRGRARRRRDGRTHGEGARARGARRQRWCDQRPARPRRPRRADAGDHDARGRADAGQNRDHHAQEHRRCRDRTLDTTITGDADFTITPGGATPCANTLAPGATCTLTITFTPRAYGARGASIAISATPGGATTLSVTAKALRPATLRVVSGATNDIVDFGDVPTGYSDAYAGQFQRVVILENVGDVTTAGVVGAAVEAEPSPVLNIVGFYCDTPRCSRRALLPDGQRAGYERAAHAGRVRRRNAGISLTLKSNGVPPAALAITPPSKDFADMYAGETPRRRSPSRTPGARPRRGGRSPRRSAERTRPRSRSPTTPAPGRRSRPPQPAPSTSRTPSPATLPARRPTHRLRDGHHDGLHNGDRHRAAHRHRSRPNDRRRAVVQQDRAGVDQHHRPLRRPHLGEPPPDRKITLHNRGTCRSRSRATSSADVSNMSATTALQGPCWATGTCARWSSCLWWRVPERGFFSGFASQVAAGGGPTLTASLRETSKLKAAPVLTLSPATLDFGTQPPSTTTATQQVTIRNAFGGAAAKGSPSRSPGRMQPVLAQQQHLRNDPRRRRHLHRRRVHDTPRGTYTATQSYAAAVAATTTTIDGPATPRRSAAPHEFGASILRR